MPSRPSSPHRQPVGAAETATTFTFTSKSSGTFTETITAAAQEGTAYTTATLTASR